MSSTAGRRNATGVRGFLRAEIAIFVSLGTVAILLWAGSRLLENVVQPVWLTLILIWLFGTVLWSAISVARHADCLAIRCGEPYGTLILTLAAISIEVMMISAAMLHQANNPTLARDTMFAVIMIALNGLVGLSLLLGGLRHKEQQYNLQGTNSYLNAILCLAVLGLILPDFTTSAQGPNFSRAQEMFLIIVSLVLYAIFLAMQTARYRKHFMETQLAAAESGAEHHEVDMGSTPYHAVMLVVYLATVVVLAEKFAIPLDRSIEQFGVPQAFGGAIVAALVLAPEAMSAVRAAVSNHMQRSINLLLGSVLATIGLTIPAVLMIGLFTGRPVTLGMQGGEFPLLLLTLAVCVVTFASGRTNVLQGCIHLLLFAVFLLLIFCP
ncbi:MAG: calcium:proton antiporter [Chthoniobacterales bacterium]